MLEIYILIKKSISKQGTNICKGVGKTKICMRYKPPKLSVFVIQFCTTRCHHHAEIVHHFHQDMWNSHFCLNSFDHTTHNSSEFSFSSTKTTYDVSIRCFDLYNIKILRRLYGYSISSATAQFSQASWNIKSAALDEPKFPEEETNSYQPVSGLKYFFFTIKQSFYFCSHNILGDLWSTNPPVHWEPL